MADFTIVLYSSTRLHVLCTAQALVWHSTSLELEPDPRSDQSALSMAWMVEE